MEPPMHADERRWSIEADTPARQARLSAGEYGRFVDDRFLRFHAFTLLRFHGF
jgi:hypothetical protein